MHEISHPHKTVLERLENSGNIVILDKQEGDYMITVKPMNIHFATQILDRYLGINKYKIHYRPEFVNWEIEFNVKGKEEKLTQ